MFGILDPRIPTFRNSAFLVTSPSCTSRRRTPSCPTSLYPSLVTAPCCTSRKRTLSCPPPLYPSLVTSPSCTSTKRTPSCVQVIIYFLFYYHNSFVMFVQFDLLTFCDRQSPPGSFLSSTNLPVLIYDLLVICQSIGSSGDDRL